MKELKEFFGLSEIEMCKVLEVILMERHGNKNVDSKDILNTISKKFDDSNKIVFGTFLTFLQNEQIYIDLRDDANKSLEKLTMRIIG